jgi:hypothetical protein
VKEAYVPITSASPGRLALAAALALGISAGSASAQTTIAYASGGPALVQSIGGRDVAWQVGGGVEVQGAGAGFGGGLDYVYFPAYDRTNSRGSQSAPALNAIAPFAQASYHFGAANALRGFADRPRLQPFVSGGLTFLIASGRVGSETLPMLHVAGGVDWWATRNTALRVEVREQFAGMLSVRCGIVVR